MEEQFGVWSCVSEDIQKKSTTEKAFGVRGYYTPHEK
jgi:hypothetical protein